MGEQYVPPDAIGAEAAEKSFREVSGVRFESSLDDETVGLIAETLKQSNEKVASGRSTPSDQELCCLEHKLAMSTADETLDPLKPNCFISGSKNLEEFQQARRSRFPKGIFGGFLSIELNDPAADKLVSTQGIKFADDPEAATAFLEAVRQANGGKTDDPRVLYDLNAMEYNAQTGRFDLPHIVRFETSDQQNIDLPPELAQKLAIQEVPISIDRIDTMDKAAKERLRDTVTGYIDAAGWRFEKK